MDSLVPPMGHYSLPTATDEHEDVSECKQKYKELTVTKTHMRSCQVHAQSPPSKFKRHFSNDLVMIPSESSPSKWQQQQISAL